MKQIIPGFLQLFCSLLVCKKGFGCFGRGLSGLGASAFIVLLAWGAFEEIGMF